MHLILEECQPVSRRVSFHKRRSSVRKSEKDAICSHLIQAADNVPRKLKFHFLNFPYCIAKFQCQLPVKASSRDSLKYRYFPHKESMYVICLVSEVKGFWVDKSNV